MSGNILSGVTGGQATNEELRGRGKRWHRGVTVLAAVALLAGCTSNKTIENKDNRSAATSASAPNGHFRNGLKYGTPAEMEAAVDTLSQGYSCTIDKFITDSLGDALTVRVQLRRTERAQEVIDKFGTERIVKATEPDLFVLPQDPIGSPRVEKKIAPLLRARPKNARSSDPGLENIGDVEDYSGRREVRLDDGTKERTIFDVIAVTGADSIDGRLENHTVSEELCGTIEYDGHEWKMGRYAPQYAEGIVVKFAEPQEDYLKEYGY